MSWYSFITRKKDAKNLEETIKERFSLTIDEFIANIIQKDEAWVFKFHGIESTRHNLKEILKREVTDFEVEFVRKLFAQKSESMQDSKTLMSRRQFLKIAGITAGAIVASNIIPVPSLFQKSELSSLGLKPIKSPDFHINETIKKDKKLAKYFIKPIQFLLNDFYNFGNLSPREVAEQTAFLNEVLNFELMQDGRVKNEITQGQILLLPFEDQKRRYFFITAYHNLKKLKASAFFYVSNAVLTMGDILGHSENCDLAFGYCFGVDILNVKKIRFTKEVSILESIYIAPSSKDTGKRFFIIGKILDANESYLFAKSTNVIHGYSGSAFVLPNGSVAGLLIYGIETNGKADAAVAVRSKHIHQLLEFCLKEYKE